MTLVGFVAAVHEQEGSHEAVVVAVVVEKVVVAAAVDCSPPEKEEELPHQESSTRQHHYVSIDKDADVAANAADPAVHREDTCKDNSRLECTCNNMVDMASSPVGTDGVVVVVLPFQHHLAVCQSHNMEEEEVVVVAVAADVAAVDNSSFEHHTAADTKLQVVIGSRHCSSYWQCQIPGLVVVAVKEVVEVADHSKLLMRFVEY
jgi:hypothetical protein